MESSRVAENTLWIESINYICLEPLIQKRYTTATKVQPQCRVRRHQKPSCKLAVALFNTLLPIVNLVHV
jgi:hypothetical protein